MRTRVLVVLLAVGVAAVCLAGWLNPSQPGFVIQTFTSYDPISGNNSGTIATNGNSYQFAGDNTGVVYIGGPGAQFRGKNDGTLRIEPVEELQALRMNHRRVEKVEDVVEEGQQIAVKVIDIDSAGKIRLSHKATLEKGDGAEGSHGGGERSRPPREKRRPR
jgi:hypothetical protein